MDLTLGTMNFGGRTPRAEAERIVHRALERGVTRFDTANLYENGESERIVGRALGAARDRVYLATKVGALRVGGKPEGLGKARVLASLDESLARLGTSHVDLFYLHVPDPTVTAAETVEALAVAFEAKKILAWGVSNHASWQILELIHEAARVGLPRPARAQQLYNVLVRQLEVEYLAFAAKYGLETEVYNPLAGGLLTEKHARVDAEKKGSRFFKNGLYERRYWSPVFFERRDQLAELAASRGLTVTTLAYRFLRDRAGIDGVVLGPSTLSHLDRALDDLAEPLDAETRTTIDKMHLAWMGTDARYAR